VDLGALAVTWRGQTHIHPLVDGSAVVRLQAGPARDEELRVEYLGTEAVAPATLQLTIQVRAAAPPSVAPTRSGLAAPPALTGLALALVVLLVAGLAVVVGVLGRAAWRKRARAPGGAAREEDAPWPQFPGAASFVAAMGLWFALLRRLRRVRPGETVREWIARTGGPGAAADGFDQARYGGLPESEGLRERGLAWLRRSWDRGRGGA
jgi:hypothetical protein